MNGRFQMQEVKTGFCRNRSMQTGSSGTLIGWKSGQTTFVPLYQTNSGSNLILQVSLYKQVHTCLNMCHQFFLLLSDISSIKGVGFGWVFSFRSAV
jgi:hypothetical protein